MAQILLVEDDRSLSAVLSSALNESGHVVIAVFDGIAASKEIRSKTPDLIVVDIFLPNKDGLEVIREVKRTSPRAKIIAISGGGRHDKRTYLRAATVLGADITIEKPFEMEELIRSIEGLLEPDEYNRTPANQSRGGDSTNSLEY